MNKITKIILTVGLIVVSSALIGALILNYWWDPNQYKTSIQAEIKKRSGYQLEIQGPLKWSLLPGLSLSIKDAKLYAPHFDKQAEPLLSLKEADLRVDLLPLLQRVVSIDVLILKEAVIKWHRAPTSLGSNLHEAALLGKTHIPSPEQKLPFNIEGLRLRQVQIVQSSFYQYADYNRLGLVLKHINFETQEGLLQTAQPMRLHAQLSRDGQHFYPIDMQANGRLSEKKLQIEDLMATVKLGALEAPLTLHGDLEVALFTDKPSVQGELQVGLVSPQIPLGGGVKEFTGSADLKYAGGTLKLKPLRLKFGDAEFVGDFDFDPQVASKQLRFNASITQFEFAIISNLLNKYASLKQSQSTGQAQKAEFHLDPAFIKTLSIDGTLKIDKSFVHQCPLDKLQMHIEADKGYLRAPMQMRLAGGSVNTRLALQTTSATPKLDFSLKTQGLNLKELGQFWLPERPMAGILETNLNLKMEGSSPTHWSKTVSGPVHLAIEHGLIAGLDLGELLAQGEQVVQRVAKQVSKNTSETATLPKLADEAQGNWLKAQKSRMHTPQTQFEHLEAEAQLQAGILTIEKLAIIDPSYKITGQGRINLHERLLDSTLQVYTSNSKQAGRALHKTPLQLQIKGPWDHPKIYPDLEAYLKNRLQSITAGALKSIGKQALRFLDPAASETTTESSDKNPAVSPTDKAVDKLKSLLPSS